MYENGYPLRYFNNDATSQKEKRKMELSRFEGPRTKFKLMIDEKELIIKYFVYLNSVFASMIFLICVTLPMLIF